MPPLFSRRVKIMKFCAWFDIVSILLTISFGVMSIGVCAKTGINSRTCSLLGITALCIICCIVKNIILKKIQIIADVYSIALENADIPKVVQSFGAKQIEDCYYLFCTIDGFGGRMLMQAIAQFDKTHLTTQQKRVNRKLNKLYSVQTMLPLHKAINKLRIHLIISEVWSTELEDWVCERPAVLLSRNESIIRAAIVTKDKKLMLPGYLGQSSLIEVKKYDSALCFLVNNLSIKGNEDF